MSFATCILTFFLQCSSSSCVSKDKTGTLTQGSFALLSINAIGNKYNRKEMLEYLVLMEERANHPLSLAIIDGARNEGIVSPKNKKVQDHTFMAGEGLSGKIDGLQIYVGNERLFKRLGLMDELSEEMENMVGNWEAMAGTVGFMSIEGAGLVCAYCVADAIRPESMEVVEALVKMGIDVHMLTGDNKDAARAIGNLVGLKPEGINSELLPEEKLRFITDLKGAQSGRSVLSNPFSRRELVVSVSSYLQRFHFVSFCFKTKNPIYSLCACLMCFLLKCHVGDGKDFKFGSLCFRIYHTILLTSRCCLFTRCE